MSSKKIRRVLLVVVAGVTLLGGITYALMIPHLQEIHVYRKATYDIPDKFDPIQSLASSDHVIANIMYDGLFKVEDGLEIAPALAESWKVSDGGKTYTIKIRDKIEFHDGTPITTNDVVAAIDRLRAPQSPVFDTYKRIAAVSKLSANEVEIKLESAYPPFIALLAASSAKVTKPGSGAYLLGTGAFKFDEIKIKDGKKVLVLSRSDANQRPDHKASIQKLELWQLEQADALKLAREGFIHDTAILTAKRGEGSPIAVENISPSASTWVLAMNNTDTELSDKELRHCLASAFQQANFIKKYAPDHLAANGFLPPQLLGQIGLPKFASAPLDECEQKYTGRSLVLDYPQVLKDADKMCATMAEDFGRIGIVTKCTAQDFNVLLDRITTKKSQLSFLAMSLDLPDVEYFLETFESTARFNIANYSSKSIDENMRLARLEQNRLERAKFFQNVNRELFENDVTLNISYPTQITYRHNCLEGFHVGLSGDIYIDYTRVKLNTLCQSRSDFEEQK